MQHGASASWRLAGTAIVLTALLTAAALWADSQVRAASGEADADQPPAKAAPGAAHTVVLAAELAAAGRERKDALLLLSAARLFAESGAKPLAGTLEGAAVYDAITAPGRNARPHSPYALAEEARSYAGDNPAVLAVLDQFRFEPPVVDSRGTAGGGNVFSRWIRPGTSATYHADFRAREPAEVSIWGDGSGDLDLVVYNAAHRPVCASRKFGDREWCGWVPRANERFTLVVESRSPLWNHYSIFTN